MEFFCYHRDRPGSAALRDELLEEHWPYMDRYSKEMIARGPTLAGDTPTGSVHGDIAGPLPSPSTPAALTQTRCRIYVSSHGTARPTGGVWLGYRRTAVVVPDLLVIVGRHCGISVSG
ncbi:YciI family protein [Streptosporangium amethystogenes]|uniref:YciI family protein n=1 Tax=Streptosporangium amethystogenes TaxID=2002 RepID=UPI0037BD7A3C